MKGLRKTEPNGADIQADIQTDMATLWLNHPSGADSVTYLIITIANKRNLILFGPKPYPNTPYTDKLCHFDCIGLKWLTFGNISVYLYSLASKSETIYK